MKQFLLLSFFCSLFVLFFINSAFAQEDPWGVNENGITIRSQDVFLLWMDDQGTSDVHSYQKIYRFKPEGIVDPTIPSDSLISVTDRKYDDRRGTPKYVDVASGKFNVDPYDDVVAVWRAYNPDQWIYISIPVFDTTGSFSISNQITLNAGEGIRQDQEIYVRTGDFDGDGLDEFVVAFRDLDDSVHLCLYDVDSTLQATPIKEFSNTKVLGSSLDHFVKYFVETADLNNDGIDEIVTCTWESSLTSSTLPITIRIYAIENGAFVPKGVKQVDVPRFSGSLEYFAMALASGQFDYDEENELVFSAAFKWGSSNASSRHYKLDVTDNLQTIFVDDPLKLNLEPHNVNSISEFSLATGDLNNDYRQLDEIVFAAGNRIRVIAVNENLDFVAKALLNVANGGASDYLQSKNYLKVKDMNMDNKEDVIVVKNIVAGTQNQGFLTAFITFTDTTLNEGTDTLFAIRLGDESGNDEYHQYAIAVGNFDGYDFRIGQPTYSTVPGLVQPLVMLNAPPTHFDKFGNDIFDVNGCFPGGGCNFTATYKHTQNSTTEVTTSVHRDWMVSGGYSHSGSITAGVGVEVSRNYEAHLIGNYGRNYNKDSTHRTTVRSTTTVSATEDDQIFYTKTNYDFWEYPIYHGNETFPRRSFLVADPKSTYGLWTSSKSLNAFNYTPDHEVNNILSYYGAVGVNPNIADTIRVLYGSTTFTINNSSDYDWNLTYTDFTNNQADTSWEAGISMGYSAAWGLTLSGDYSGGNMVTHTTTVENQTKLSIGLGSTDPAIPQTDYEVLPYAYWGTNGALVIDYAVNPVLGSGGLETWWQVKYGHNPDPTFILPWKLDPEKGINLNDETQRFLTQDIIFSNRYPNPGDTLIITAQVRNFSLIPTLAPVTVKFYLNDPDSGGTPIIGVNGTNTVSTDGFVGARKRSDVEFKWVVPSSLPQYPRIYAALDKDNAIAEIHEDNNKAFNILGLSAITDIMEEYNIVPEEYALYQSYPNPFNPSTTIKYSIPQSDKVSIKVYDILGSEVSVLTNEYKTAGTYSVEFNASQFASGVYFYQIRSGNFVETKKMVLLK